MSLLRQRAMDRSVESTLSALRPAAARLWFVSATRSFSDAALKAPSAQAAAGDGAARLNTEVTAKTNATAVAMRRVIGERHASRHAIQELRGSPGEGPVWSPR